MTITNIFFKGLTTGGSLIVAIGAQNAFVLKQGLARKYVLWTALTCSIIDVILIGLGIGGIGYLLEKIPGLFGVAKWGGVLFLAWYGTKALKAAFQQESLNLQQTAEAKTLKQTIGLLVAISLLNPHVYVDTMMLLGSIGAQFEAHRWIFALGAMSASILWFFLLSFGATFLAPLFESQKAWKILEFLIALTMYSIAASLIFFL